jgi:hypothetical protein
MRATEFELRHQTLIHQLLVGAGLLTYLLDRDDVVWRFVKNSAEPHVLERLAFVFATLFIAVGAVVCTRSRALGGGGSAARERQRWLGDFCYTIGLASLVPLAGFVLLVGGEGLRVLRLMGSASRTETWKAGAEQSSLSWGTAFRREAVKWGILVTMIVFVIALRDRDADVLVVASFLTGLLLNIR